jgi:dTDP-4-amino-4,6-dideoxygalactose transaminase
VGVCFEHAGTFGDCGVLSFYSTKNLTTGDRGMILTDDDSLAAWFKLISQQGVTTVAWQRLSAEGTDTTMLRKSDLSTT